VRHLLQQPALLLDLQELVLSAGGAYWNRVAPAASNLTAPVERGLGKLRAFLATHQRQSSSGPAILPVTRPVAWYRRPWVVSLATAAVVLLAVILWRQFVPPSAQPIAATAWGWNKPDALPKNVSAAAYLNRLADGAEEWFDKRPEEPMALAQRIGELRQGCSRLIFAEHQALPDKERTWLVEKCRGWAARLDHDREALEAGQDARQVLARTDETVRQVIDTLRTQARELSAA
jgi:hypothetical protein